MCNKTEFKTFDLAQKRANEINKENGKKRKYSLRPYQCDECKLYHLTKQTKKTYRYNHDLRYRNRVNEERFIAQQTEIYERKFGIKLNNQDYGK